MADNRSDDPQAIERDIERTQDSIGETVEKIEEKLTPREVTRSVLGDSGQEWVREGLRMARDNPVPVAMIAIGAIWLFATSDSPLVKRMSDRLSRAVHGDSADGLRSRNEEPAPIGVAARPPEQARHQPRGESKCKIRTSHSPPGRATRPMT